MSLRAYVFSVVAGPVMVISSRDDLAALQEDRSKHWATRSEGRKKTEKMSYTHTLVLGCGLETPRKIMLGLVHDRDS